MRTTDQKRATRTAFFRLGPHTTPRAVSHALRERGIQVDEQLIRQVEKELLKESTGARGVKVSSPVRSRAARLRPQGFSGWRDK